MDCDESRPIICDNGSGSVKVRQIFFSPVYRKTCYIGPDNQNNGF